jgi:hypothetical protein
MWSMIKEMLNIKQIIMKHSKELQEKYPRGFDAGQVAYELRIPQPSVRRALKALSREDKLINMMESRTVSIYKVPENK